MMLTLHNKLSTCIGRFARIGKQIVLALFVTLIYFASMPVWADENVSEYSLKAAVVFNMPLYTEWPPTINTSDVKTNFNLCVYGKTPLIDELRLLEGKLIKGNRLAVLSINEQSTLRDCQVLLIPKGLANPNRAELIQKLQNKSTLVIGDDAEPPPDQVMINLLMEDGKVIFQANPELAKSAGLKLSSKLLRLAKAIYPK